MCAFIIEIRNVYESLKVCAYIEKANSQIFLMLGLTLGDPERERKLKIRVVYNKRRTDEKQNHR